MVTDVLPFSEINSEDGRLSTRIFMSDVKDEELKWHWDEEDRIIRPFHKTDWKFQFDNQLPIEIVSKIEIPKRTWHRLIKGTDNLKLLIERKS
jgi:hypothetical protein